ncbi:Pimeloyl-ACP methyl ester carboxylesterase [Roseateles sp. YR242]|uniref:alpha/beta fold hydrolase n=1 Tax=Roseateles sp. YR242 TaxID=1855305 RepID=UPI0008C58530|nr:alpha/beta hydrolase [Roseateles sp. YR242]SEK53762.1 Pimeloyl-ACP methyl ester carboxylesterase [Roseateles sp. YR242]
MNPSTSRRCFLNTSALGLGALASLSLSGTAGAAWAAASPAPAAFGPLRQIQAGLLNVGYAELGPANGPVVVLLHGWPYDIHSFIEVAPQLARAGYRVIVPHLRGHGSTRFLSSDTFRNGQQSAVAMDIVALLDALNIPKAVFAGFDWGARTADVIAALWPERCEALVSVSGYLIGNRDAIKNTALSPEAEYAWWYQFYFATEHGRAGYEKNRHDFARLIWRTASPRWNFDEATFQRSAASLDNPDHVDIVIHNYRWRQSLADGERAYDALEQRLAAGPQITVPTLVLEGDANGAPHASSDAPFRSKFSGKYGYRVITGGIGHNLPQEAPGAFAQAVLDVVRL